LDVKNDKVRQVRVDMGEPILEASRIPTTLPGNPPVNASLALPDKSSLKVTCVSMGNPHCVTFVDTITDALVLITGPQVERHEAFPRRTNVEFVRIIEPDDLTVRVWERGSGETMACGTGACAVAGAGARAGGGGEGGGGDGGGGGGGGGGGPVGGVRAVHPARQFAVALRGVAVRVHWLERHTLVYRAGPAVEVFSGEWPD